MPCQPRRGAAGTLAASWPSPRTMGLGPSRPSFLCFSFCSLMIVMQSSPSNSCWSPLSHRCRQGFQTVSPLSRFVDVDLGWLLVLSGLSRCWAVAHWATHEGHPPHLRTAGSGIKHSNVSSGLQVTADSCSAGSFQKWWHLLLTFVMIRCLRSRGLAGVLAFQLLQTTLTVCSWEQLHENRT